MNRIIARREARAHLVNSRVIVAAAVMLGIAVSAEAADPKPPNL